MSSLKKRLRTILPRSMREMIVKKVTLEDLTVFNHMIVINLSLRNFYNLSSKKNVEFILSDGCYSEQLSYKIEKNSASIFLENEIFKNIQGNSTIKMKVDGKNMIVRPSEDIQNKTSFFKNDKYFNILVNGTIILEPLFSEYNFKEDAIIAEDISASYERLEVDFKEDMIDYKLAFLYPNKIVELDNIGLNNKIVTNDFDYVTMGRASLYILKDFQMIPVQFSGSHKIFSTKSHKVDIIKRADETLLFIENHTINLMGISYQLKEDTLSLSLNSHDKRALKSLILNDTISETTISYPLYMLEGSYTADLPLDDLMDKFSRKRFSVLTTGEEKMILQPNLNDIDPDSLGSKEVINYNFEAMKIWFYKRKDNGLGFKATRPRLRRQVTEIEGNELSGFVSGLEHFVDSKIYIIFEDRYSKEQILLPIENDFSIDLSLIDFIQLKSKGKTIIDLFVGIVHDSGEIVRQVKIKYEFADYKKDNYYGVFDKVDDEGNRHYFLITTTPFDNLKIETFLIPSGIPLPEDKPKKDYQTWLVGERYDTAQDNGYAFYQYLKQHTDIKAYYVIEDTAVDYEKISDDPNVLAFGSKEHYQISFKAGVLLGTHDLENLLPYKPARGFFNYEATIKVFLQHGVLGRKRVEYHKKYYDLPFDLFIVSSQPEKYNVVVKKLGYDEDEVAITGLARFDSLPRNNETKDILLMPTWRDWINTDEQFLDSQYFNYYNNLIHNERLIKILEDNNVQLNFYPHYRAQMYFNSEILNPSNNINFIELGSKTVQDLLIEHSLLITDYSSVSFDFTLMDKPVIYYHFDVRKFFRQGKLRPLHQTFIGEIARTEDELITLIQEQIHQNFKTGNIDISGIFEYQDHDNCLRIYNSVLNKLEELDHK